MALELVEEKSEHSRPVHLAGKAGLDGLGLSQRHRAWAEANGFDPSAGKLLLLPGEDGAVAGALFGAGDGAGGFAPLATGAIAKALPAGDWHFAQAPAAPELAVLGLVMGAYTYGRYVKPKATAVRFALPEGVERARVLSLAGGVNLARDLVNTPTNDMGPADLENAALSLAARHGAAASVVTGDALLQRNLPMIHAVGRASAEAPRLIDFSWGEPSAPKLTLVGKGVCFDTGGLDIKTASGMLLMKKDMGGAANVLGLAAIIMEARLPVRLRVLIPAVENAIAGNAFRPGDVLRSRKGLTVEVGNTDAEGRLILADALALGDEEQPDLMVDMATLTGAARVALGPDLPPFYTHDDALAAALSGAAEECADPLWRMPLWKSYEAKLSSKVADLGNVTTDGFAGSVTAALFLSRFVDKARSWAHFDIFAWNPADRPHGPTGGEAQAIRALEQVIRRRYGG